MVNSDGGSCLDDRPYIINDVYGFLLWEYRRLNLLTHLPSSKFHYDADLDSDQGEKGTVCVSFSFQSLFGEEVVTNHTISVDDKWDRTRCKSQYINQLCHILKSFDREILTRFVCL